MPKTALSPEASARQAWVGKARAFAVNYAKDHGYVTADDVRRDVPLPEGVDARVLGSVFISPNLTAVGFVPTSVRSSHSRTIRVFRYQEA